MATTGSGIVAPTTYPVRKPTDPKQNHGRIVNPVRFYEVGGAAGPSIWSKDVTPDSQSPQKNVAQVEKPTSMKGAHANAESSGE